MERIPTESLRSNLISESILQGFYLSAEGGKPCRYSLNCLLLGNQDYKDLTVLSRLLLGLSGLTIDHERGYALRKLFFTKNDNDVFAVVPKWPKEKSVFRDFIP